MLHEPSFQIINIYSIGFPSYCYINYLMHSVKRIWILKIFKIC
jgi:hypothetical protein